MARRCAGALLLFLACSVPALRAAAGPVEEDELEDVLSGFDDEAYTPEDDAVEAPAGPLDFLELGGDLSLGSSYNYRQHASAVGSSYGNLSRLRAQLDLELDVRLPAGWRGRIEGYGFYDLAYRIHGRDDYTNDVLEDYEWEVGFKDFWVQGRLLETLDLKAGRQIVNWGRSDTVRVLDVLNPLDNREPGLVDIEDLRLPVTMVRIDYYPRWIPEAWGTWSAQALVIPEYRQNRNPSFGSDFNPLPFNLPNPDLPRQFGSAPEYGGSIGGIFPGWDVSFYAARVYENQRLVISGLRDDSHVTMVGSGGNAMFGNWLFKAEIGWFYGIEYGVVRAPLLTRADKSRLDTMAGVEYSGFEDVQIAFEIVDRHIFGFESGMRVRGPDGRLLLASREDQIESALRCTMDLLNARLHLTAVGLVFGAYAQDGSVVRAEASYDLRDALKIEGGIVVYQEGDSLIFRDIGRNDRLFLRIAYAF